MCDRRLCCFTTGSLSTPSTFEAAAGRGRRRSGPPASRRRTGGLKSGNSSGHRRRRRVRRTAIRRAVVRQAAKPPPPRKLEMVEESELGTHFERKVLCLNLVTEAKEICFWTKGQLISKCPFSVFKSPKKPTKKFQDFCRISPIRGQIKKVFVRESK